MRPLTTDEPDAAGGIPARRDGDADVEDELADGLGLGVGRRADHIVCRHVRPVVGSALHGEFPYDGINRAGERPGRDRASGETPVAHDLSTGRGDASAHVVVGRVVVVRPLDLVHTLPPRRLKKRRHALIDERLGEVSDGERTPRHRRCIRGALRGRDATSVEVDGALAYLCIVRHRHVRPAVAESVFVGSAMLVHVIPEVRDPA